MNRLVVALLFAAACSSPTPADSRADSSINQFSRQREALTLPDGGQCSVIVSAPAELMIRDLPVVEDPVRTVWTGATSNPSDGAWTFGRLMTSMAGANDPSVFVLNWLRQWDTPQAVNGFPVASRPMNQLVTQPWLAASGGVRLDLTKAPFRLLAIVNRMDLRSLANGSAGEGRFVFGVLDPAGNPLQFTVILEYRLPATTDADVRAWADQWHALSQFPVGSAQYNQALEVITNKFAGANVAPGRPNGSSINQVRSNEIALAAPWEMREFHLDSTQGGALVEVPVAQTTDLTLNNSPPLATFINQNTTALLNGTHVVPATFNGAPFLAGSALTPPGHFWNAPGITNNDARFAFSVNTCNGCHAGETGTAFLHVAPRARGVTSVLSTFLTGKTQPDPVSGAPRSFNDLDFRASSLGAVLCAGSATTVRVTAPTAGSTVRGTTTLTVAVSADVNTVQYFVDGNPVSPPLGVPFTGAWQADSLPFGVHAITAVATAPGSTVTSAPVSVTTAPTNGPDFAITGFSAPSIASPGAQVAAQVTVCNKGNQPGTTPIDLVLSADTTFSLTGTTPDRLVGNAPSPMLNPGQCSTLTINGTATPNGPNGVYFFGAVADAPGSIIELDESNNVSTLNPLAIGNGPDLVVTSVSVRGSVLLGASFTSQVVVCNRGNAPSPSAPVDLVLSLDSTIALPVPPAVPTPTDDVLAGTGTVQALQPSQCALTSITGTAFPPGGVLGAYFVGAIVDRPNGVLELFENNNSTAGNVMGIGSAPDFTVSIASAPPAVLPGSTLSVTVRVCNVGTVAGTTNVDLALSTDSTIAPPVPPAVPGPNDDRLIGGTSVSLNANACSNVTISASATPPGAPGVYFLGAIADFPRAVVELNETNNTASKVLAIASGPDFTVSTVTGPSSAQPGAPFTASAVVCNQGTAFGTANVDLMLSVDSTITVDAVPGPTSDRSIGMASVSLAPGQCVTQSIPATANAINGQATYTLGAVVDMFNQVPELFETNNVTTQGLLTFSIGFMPDFVITSFTPTTMPSSTGKTSQGIATVCNRGTVAAPASVDLVLAPTATFAQARSLNIAPVQVFLSTAQCQQVTLNGGPPPFAGVAFFGALVDMNNTAIEFIETNNASSAFVVVL